MPIGKLCFFVPFYPMIKGGAEYQSKIIAGALHSAGYEIVYISYGHDTNDCIEEDGFKVYRLKVDAGFISKTFLYKKFMKEVCKIITEERPNFIYQRILNSFTY